MPAQQLHLFAVPRPLEERLGKSFFAAVPRCPGVYIMTGPGDRVLYIGQSSNLRARLASYKIARLDRAPRKVVRLVHQVDKIVWERCDSPRAAQLRESELLLLHRPRFNRVGTFPRTQWILEVHSDVGGLEINRHNPAVSDAPKRRERERAAHEFTLSEGEHIYGPYVNGIALHGALVRCLWFISGQVASPADFPAGLLNWRVPSHQRIERKKASPGFDCRVVATQLRQLLLGQTTTFLERVQTLVLALELRCLRELILSDFELLQKTCAATARGVAPSSPV